MPPLSLSVCLNGFSNRKAVILLHSTFLLTILFLFSDICSAWKKKEVPDRWWPSFCRCCWTSKCISWIQIRQRLYSSLKSSIEWVFDRVLKCCSAFFMISKWLWRFLALNNLTISEKLSGCHQIGAFFALSSTTSEIKLLSSVRYFILYSPFALIILWKHVTGITVIRETFFYFPDSLEWSDSRLSKPVCHVVTIICLIHCVPFEFGMGCIYAPNALDCKQGSISLSLSCYGAYLSIPTASLCNKTELRTFALYQTALMSTGEGGH